MRGLVPWKTSRDIATRSLTSPRLPRSDLMSLFVCGFWSVISFCYKFLGGRREVVAWKRITRTETKIAWILYQQEIISRKSVGQGSTISSLLKKTRGSFCRENEYKSTVLWCGIPCTLIEIYWIDMVIFFTRLHGVMCQKMVFTLVKFSNFTWHEHYFSEFDVFYIVSPMSTHPHGCAV